MKSRRKKETQSLSVHRNRPKREGYQNLAILKFQTRPREPYNLSEMTSSLQAVSSLPGKQRNKTHLRTSNMLPLGMRDFYRNLESRTLVNDMNKSANVPTQNPLTAIQGPIHDSYNLNPSGHGEYQYPTSSQSNCKLHPSFLSVNSVNAQTQKCTLPTTDEAQSIKIVKSIERPKTNYLYSHNGQAEVPIVNQAMPTQSETEQGSDMRSYLVSSEIGRRPLKRLFSKDGPLMFNNDADINEYVHSSFKQSHSNLSHQKPSSYYSTFCKNNAKQKPLSYAIPLH